MAFIDWDAGHFSHGFYTWLRYKGGLSKKRAYTIVLSLTPAYQAQSREECELAIAEATKTWEDIAVRHFERTEKLKIISSILSEDACVNAGKVTPDGNVKRGNTQGCESLHHAIDLRIELENKAGNTSELVAIANSVRKLFRDQSTELAHARYKDESQFALKAMYKHLRATPSEADALNRSPLEPDLSLLKPVTLEDLYGATGVLGTARWNDVSNDVDACAQRGSPPPGTFTVKPKLRNVCVAPEQERKFNVFFNTIGEKVCANLRLIPGASEEVVEAVVYRAWRSIEYRAHIVPGPNGRTFYLGDSDKKNSVVDIFVQSNINLDAKHEPLVCPVKCVITKELCAHKLAVYLTACEFKSFHLLKDIYIRIKKNTDSYHAVYRLAKEARGGYKNFGQKGAGESAKDPIHLDPIDVDNRPVPVQLKEFLTQVFANDIPDGKIVEQAVEQIQRAIRRYSSLITTREQLASLARTAVSWNKLKLQDQYLADKLRAALLEPSLKQKAAAAPSLELKTTDTNGKMPRK